MPDSDDDPRLEAPSALRNRDAIREVLRPRLAGRRMVLEVASGSGMHVVHLAEAFPDGTFQPSDRDAAARASVDAWVKARGLANVRPAVALDAAAASWPVTAADAVLCINMIHIAPWAAALGLLAGAARLLPSGGLLYLYGPFVQAGVATTASNLAFDAGLRARDPAWGLRHLSAVAEAAAAEGFAAPEVVAMPANNLSVSFRR